MALRVLLCHAVRAVTIWSPSWVASHGQQSVAMVDGVIRDLGAWGVGLFFVLSGLCIHLPAARVLASNTDLTLALKPYFARRMRRIYPPHLIALLLSIFVAAALPMAEYGVHPMISVPSWGQFFAHLAMVHTFLPGAMYSVNHVMWSIAVEFHFYLLYPLLLLARRRYGMTTLCIALFVLSLALKLGGKLIVDENLKAILWQSFACRFWEWVLGCVLAERIARPGQIRVTNWTWVVAAIVVSYLIGAAAFRLPYGNVWRSCVWPPLLCGVIYVCCGLNVAKKHCLARVGKASYSLYLVHPIALSAALVGARYLGAPWFLEFSAGLVAALLVTLVFFHFVEKPFFAKRLAPTVFPNVSAPILFPV